MEETPEQGIGSSGVSRRDFVKKSAILGGMVWAAPAISTVGSRAFAQQAPGGSPIVVEDCLNFYQAKFETDGLAGFDTSCNLPDFVDGEPACKPAGWDEEGRICLTAAGDAQLSINLPHGDGVLTAEVVEKDGKTAVKFILPPDCFLEGVDAKAGGAAPGSLNCNETVTEVNGENSVIVGLEGDQTADVSFALITFCC